MSVNVFSTKVLIGDTIFYFSYWRGDRHFTWSSEPREGLAACSAKGVPSFLSYFKTLSIGPAPGIEPAIPTERTLPRLKVLQQKSFDVGAKRVACEIKTHPMNGCETLFG